MWLCAPPAFPLLYPDYDDKELRDIVGDIHYESDEGICKVKLQILQKLQELAAYACRNQESGRILYIDYEIFYKALSYVSYDMDEAGLIGLLDELEKTEHDMKSGGVIE